MHNISFSEFSHLLLNPHLKESEHVKNIKEISSKFTKNRDEIKDYVLDENLVSSYTMFYLPTNALKFDFILNKLPEEIKATIFNSEFIDVGCGPGTYSYALSRHTENQKITCVDTSALMLSQAKKILEHKYPQNHFEFQRKIDTKKNGGTLFFGNSINEMGIQNALDLVNIVNPDIVFFIEPGTSELFVELKKMRTILLDEYDVVYPCPSNEKCHNHWCHQILRVSLSHDVERLSQLVSLDRKIMPLCGHVYVKKNKFNFNKSNELTIVRYLNETKFSFIYDVCDFEAGENKIVKIEILKKNMTKEMEKKYKNASVGDRIVFIKEKLVGDTWRGHVHS